MESKPVEEVANELAEVAVSRQEEVETELAGVVVNTQAEAARKPVAVESEPRLPEILYMAMVEIAKALLEEAVSAHAFPETSHMAPAVRVLIAVVAVALRGD